MHEQREHKGSGNTTQHSTAPHSTTQHNTPPSVKEMFMEAIQPINLLSLLDHTARSWIDDMAKNLSAVNTNHKTDREKDRESEREMEIDTFQRERQT